MKSGLGGYHETGNAELDSLAVGPPKAWGTSLVPRYANAFPCNAFGLGFLRVNIGKVFGSMEPNTGRGMAVVFGVLPTGCLLFEFGDPPKQRCMAADTDYFHTQRKSTRLPSTPKVKLTCTPHVPELQRPYYAYTSQLHSTLSKTLLALGHYRRAVSPCSSELGLEFVAEDPPHPKDTSECLFNVSASDRVTSCTTHTLSWRYYPLLRKYGERNPPRIPLLVHHR
jgi:hypothetical protein